MEPSCIQLKFVLSNPALLMSPSISHSKLARIIAVNSDPAAVNLNWRLIQTSILAILMRQQFGCRATATQSGTTLVYLS